MRTSGQLAELQHALALIDPREEGGEWVAVSPRDSAGIATAVQAARSAGVPVWIRGAGSKEGTSRPPGPGLIVRTTRLNSQPEVRTANLTATFSAGAAVAGVDGWLAPYGLFWPIEDVFPAATVGGTLSAGISGPRRLGYGSLRDRVLALEVVTAGGEIIRTGRPTMKDVAAYNLTRLLCGAQGTLGVITSATFRLSPVPPASGSVAARFNSAEQAFVALLPLLRQAPLPAAADWLSRGGREGDLLVRFDGEPAGVAQQLAGARQALAPTALSLEIRDNDDNEAAWAERRSEILRLTMQAPVRLRMGVAPGQTGAAATLLASNQGSVPDWVTAHMGSGIVVAGFGQRPARGELLSMRAEAAQRGGYLIPEAGPPDLQEELLPPTSWAESAVRGAMAAKRFFNPHIGP